MRPILLVFVLFTATCLIGCTDKGKDALDKGKAAQEAADFPAALAAYKEAQTANPDSPSGREAATKIAEVEKSQKQIDEMTEGVSGLAKALSGASAREEGTPELIDPDKPVAIKTAKCPPLKTPVPQKIEDVEGGYVATNDDKNAPTFKCARWEPPKPLKFQVNVTGDDKTLKVTGARKFGAKIVEVTLTGTYDGSGGLKFGKPELAKR